MGILLIFDIFPWKKREFYCQAHTVPIFWCGSLGCFFSPSLQIFTDKLHICVVCLYIRYRPRLFNQVGYQTTCAYIENKHFFTKSCHRPTCQNYEQPPQSLQNLYFQSHFLVSKIKRIFVLCFLKMCPIFVGSVHNFGRSDHDII